MSKTRPFGFWKAAMVMMLVTAACLPFAKAQTTEDGSSDHPFLIENSTEFWHFYECMTRDQVFYFHPTYEYDIVSGGTGRGTYLLQSEVDSLENLGQLAGVHLDTIVQGGKSPGEHSVGLHFKLLCDVVVNEGNVAGCDGVKDPTWREWSPLWVFGGHFNGDYHVVSGIFCSKTGASEAGFFAQLTDSASVRNLGVANAFISGNGYVGGYRWLVG